MKLLRAHGVRDVERLREDELREALANLAVLLPEPGPATPWSPPPPASVIHQVARAADVDMDLDDPHCLPRFREPRPFLPDHERLFVRAICVAPRRVYCTWDVSSDLLERPARLDVAWLSFLGNPPDEATLNGAASCISVDIDLRAPGWYVEVPADRLALQVRLVVASDDDGFVVQSRSNIALAPPARPAPPGPLWMATLSPSTDRRRLRGGTLAQVQESEGVRVEEVGEVEAVVESVVEFDPINSTVRMRSRGEEASPSPPSSSSSLGLSSGLSGGSGA